MMYAEVLDQAEWRNDQSTSKPADQSIDFTNKHQHEVLLQFRR
jgi:hypothetical protein